MTATDLCRHLAADCSSFYLCPRYTTHEGLPEFVARIDRKCSESVSRVLCVLTQKCILVCYIARGLSSRTLRFIAFAKPLSTLSASKKFTNGRQIFFHNCLRSSVVCTFKYPKLSLYKPVFIKISGNGIKLFVQSFVKLNIIFCKFLVISRSHKYIRF